MDGKEWTERISQEEWDLQKARHLLNRAGFGVTHDLALRLAALSPEDAVRYLVYYEDKRLPETAPDFLLKPLTKRQFLREYASLSAEERRHLFNLRQQDERYALVLLQGWWLAKMHSTPAPLEEKMALFWHGHFAVSAQKVKFSQIMYHYYDTLRRHATGNVRTLTTAVGQTPAMLEYLDQRKSHKTAPNENWARELMELFTLGRGHYTEKDIKEAARAFTGWTCDWDGFLYREKDHDDGTKVFLGVEGKLDGWDIIRIIFEQPACADFLARKLYLYFVGEPVHEPAAKRLAAVLRSHDYELKPVLTTLFLSRGFYASEVMGRQIKCPAQYVVRLCEDLQIRPPYEALARACAALGQRLFYPPNVKGWEGNRAWINPDTLLTRYNLPRMLALAALREDARAGASNMMNADRVNDEASISVGRAMTSLVEGSSPNTCETTSGDPGVSLTSADLAQFHSGRGLRRQADMFLAPWMNAIRATTAGEYLDALAIRLLTQPLSSAQKQELAQILTPAGDLKAPLDPLHVPTETRRALLHLFTSLAEYQLC